MQQNVFKVGFALVMLVSILTYGATIAHWDFNDPGLGAVNGAAVPDSDGWTVWRQAAADKSGNGNDLTTWEWAWAGFNWSSDSPAGDFSIESMGDFPAAMTWSQQSLPAGTDIETITPSAFTIEAVVKLTSVNNVATFVGRDGQNIGGVVDTADRAPLYFSVRDWYGAGNQSLVIAFTDVQGYTHSAGGNGLSNIAFDTWYHVAAVSDGLTLKLYIEGIEVASDDMTVSGSTDTRMAIGNGSGAGWDSGTFTVARGLWAGDHTDRWYGKIDEVAISNAALDPASFVIEVSNTPPAAPSGLGATAGNSTVTLDWADSTEYITGYHVYRGTNSGGPYTQIASDLSLSFYKDDTVVNGMTYYYVVTAVGAFENESDMSTEVSVNPNLPAPRYMEKLDRGVVAVYRGGSTVYVGWRMFGTEPETVGYNVYRGQTKLNALPITGSTNYIDYGGSLGSTYRVAAVINSVEQGLSDAVEVWGDFYHDIPLQRPAGGTVPDLENPGEYISYDYSPNDASVGDLDGDGQYEIVLKWDPSNSRDNTGYGYTGNVYLDAYEMDGTFLWRIDLGINIQAGPHYTQFMVYDLDSDGIAEVACKTADGTVDGMGTVIGDPGADWRNANGAILSGPEYLTVFDGSTGAALDTVDYVPPRGDICDWGDCYGNRVDRFLACVAYLDGQQPSLVMCRGYYAKTVLAAWDFANGQLTQRWVFDSDDPGNSAYAGQGNHNLTVADVDADGKDEIIYGSCTIDDDGTGLYSTGLGHGDAMHVSDMDINRPGLELFMCHESSPYGTTLRDAATGEILWQLTAGGDTGRCSAAHIDSRYPGYQMWSVASGGTYNAVDQSLISSNIPNYGNFLIWWDGDLQREILDDVSTHNNPYINKWYGDGAGRLLSLYNIPTAYSTSSNNWTKGNPCLSGDILGDWREECIYRSSDNTKLRIFTPTEETSHRIYTLMHDPQYRLAMAWQNVSYNQPPHPSFYIGAGMNTPPTPNIIPVGTPVFTADPISNSDAIELTDYAGDSLATYVDDPQGIGIFSKDAGPDWLAVATDGTLSGIPNDSHVGENIFTVRVTDDQGLYDTAQMTIQVGNVYSGVGGLEDLSGFAARWLMTDCVDIPACGGADLNGDQDVDMDDVVMLSSNWLADESLQLHLKFNQTGGSTALDSSVYTRSGDLVNGPIWTSGQVGGALEFDGIDDYVEISNFRGITGGASRTCAAWIKTTKTDAQILSWGQPVVNGKWVIRTNDDGALRTEVSGGYIFGTTDIADGQWHHIAVVLEDDGSADISEVLLYVDGQPEAIGGVIGTAIKTEAADNAKVGVYVVGGLRYFQGLIDEVRVYNRALSETDIQSLTQ